MAIKVNGTTVIDDSRNLTNIGSVSASSFSGDGSGLTNLPASAPTTAQVLSATAGATAGAVGTYAWLGQNTGSATISTGSTYSGSSLRYAGSGMYSWATPNTSYSTSRGATPSGTWRAVGYCASGYSTVSPTTVFLRIS